MEFFFRPWVGPVLAFLALVASYLGRSGVLPNDFGGFLCAGVVLCQEGARTIARSGRNMLTGGKGQGIVVNADYSA